MVAVGCTIRSTSRQIARVAGYGIAVCRSQGFRKIGRNIKLLWNYVSDVVSRRYTHYNTHALLLIIAGLIYLVTPVDFLPDFLVGGLIDDVSVLLYIVQSVSEELKRYENHKLNQSLPE